MERPYPDTATCPELERALWILYRDFFDLAEKKRRWRVRDDIPWDRCNPRLDPAIADVIETFCAVEMYLPDYTSKILPLVRNSKGRAWFYANWGYEESKHSLALHDWLLRSGHRTDEQLADLEGKVFAREWNLPLDSALGMLTYAMVQEVATWLNYRNLRDRVTRLGGDPALEQILLYLAVDEKAHHSFFRDCFALFLKFDRPAALEQLRAVMNRFMMPAIHDLLDESPRRIARIRELDIFSETQYMAHVYYPLLRELGVDRSEMRSPRAVPKSARV
jgi:acyl-[acyl-carrier-protein] desaturase